MTESHKDQDFICLTDLISKYMKKLNQTCSEESSDTKKRVTDGEVYFLITFGFILLIISLLIGWNSLESLDNVHSSMSNNPSAMMDAKRIVADSFSISKEPMTFEWNSLHGGGPLRYFYLVPIYILLSPPTTEVALKIGNSFASIIYFVIIPMMFGGYIYKTNGRLTTLFSILSVYIIGRGILLLIPYVPKQFVIVGMGQYYTGLWQQVFPLPFAILMLMLLESRITEPGYNLNTLVIGGIVLGIIGATQYVIGFLTALIITFVLINHHMIRELVIIASISGIFIPFIIIMPSSSSQALNGIGRLFDFGFNYLGISSIILVISLIFIYLSLFMGYSLSKNSTHEFALAASAGIYFIYPGYLSERTKSLFIMLLLGGLTIILVNLSKERFSIISRIDEKFIDKKSGIALGLILGGSIFILLLLSIGK
jgi:hypothetical protein